MPKVLKIEGNVADNGTLLTGVIMVHYDPEDLQKFMDDWRKEMEERKKKRKEP